MERNLILIFAGILLHQINGQQMELVAGHVLFRHGDRTPITTYSTDPIQEKDWPNGFGQLTTAGIEQSHRLGKYLRTRYGSILSTKYNPSEILVRSTDYDRTLMSAQSNLIGLYPLSNISNGKVPIQPVPIHTVPADQDVLLAAIDCPRHTQIFNNIRQSVAVKEKNDYYKAFFKQLERWTGVSNIAILDDWKIADTILIEHSYNKTPAWADDDVRRKLSDMIDLSYQLFYSNKDSSRIRGGPVIQDMWKNMYSASHKQPYRNVKMYSAHDTTLSPALNFLGINYPYPPQYASALFVDLYKRNLSYFVKVEFLNVTDSNIAHAYLLKGCPAIECPFDIFTSIYQPRFPASANEECAISNFK